MLNRRTFFGTTAAVAIAAAPAVTVADVSADRELLELGRQWEIAVERRATAIELADRLLAEHERTKPKTPRLRATAEDCERGIGRNGGVGTTIPWESVLLICRRAREWRAQPEPMPGRLKWAERFERAYERHDTALRRHAESIGLTTADAEYDAAYDALNAIEERIVAAPCSSLEGLRVKARVAKRLIPPITDTENDWHDTAALTVIDSILSGRVI